MITVCIWLLERALPAELADHVIGDIMEQRERGAFWIVRQTLAAILLLRRPVGSGDGVVAGFIGDVRFGARQLRRARAFTAAATATLALAIGATVTIFSVVQPVLLRPLPFPSPDRLAFVWERGRDGGRDNLGFQTVRDIAANAKTIERWAAIGTWSPTVGGDEPERINGDRVSWSYFRTLGAAPAMGRDFLPEEDQPDRNRVVILSYGLWQRKFGGDSSIVGRPISVGGTPMTVVGVMPQTFDNVATPTAEMWRVLGYAETQPWACRSCHHLRMIVRVRAGVSMQSAEAEISGIHARLHAQFPTEYAAPGAFIVAMQEEMTRSFRPALLALFGAVTLVLLIALANVLNLQLARVVRRETELAIRVALGASRGRVTRQLFAEAVLLAGIGGIAGACIAALTIPLIAARLPRGLPRAGAIHLDIAALALTTGIVLAVAVVLALLPARRGTEASGASLRSGTRLAGGGHQLTRSGLVVVEVALAAMLLSGAALIGRSFVRLLAVDVGFDTSHLVTMEVDAVGPRYASNEAIYAYHERLREAVRAVPGVTSAALANQVPLAGNVDRYGVDDPDHPLANPELAQSADRYVVTPEFFATMRIPILRGRAFTPADSRDTVNKIVLVSAALAARMWPGQDAIGRRIRVGGPQAPPRTVVGVTGNVKHDGLDATTTMQWYAPAGQWFDPDREEAIVARTSLDAATMSAAIHAAVHSVDPGVPIVRVATMDGLVARSSAQRRFALVLFASFATAALLLAVAGIYGVLAGSVAERRREIGVRAALGATPREILGLILRRGTALAGAGLVAGIAGTAVLSRYIRTFLFGVEPHDPVTLAAVAGTLIVVTLIACAAPAMRAVRIDPSEALRAE